MRRRPGEDRIVRRDEVIVDEKLFIEIRIHLSTRTVPDFARDMAESIRERVRELVDEDEDDRTVVKDVTSAVKREIWLD